MTKQTWLERCAYKLYELRKKHGIAGNSASDWHWAENIANEIHHPSRWNWDSTENEYVENIFLKFLDHQSDSSNHSHHYVADDPALSFSPTFFPIFTNPGIF